MTSNYSSDYPYFIYPAVMALRNGEVDPEEEARLRRIVAANVGDIPALRLMLGIDPEDFAAFYPDLTPPALSTDDTISSFLTHFGRDKDTLPQAAADIPQPEDFTPDEPTEELLSNPAQEEISEQNARILIKNHDYQGALEIIMRLSLNIPEKSIYFADQIRFLKKLILNEERKNSSTADI